ncbi:unnamed protein product [Rotaria magnacalcarata]
MKHLIDIIFQAFAIILRNDLNSSHVHFEQKKLLLHFTIHDAYLVKSFYDLNPTEKQIHLVQQIWRTKLNSCERLLQKLIAYIEENLNSSLSKKIKHQVELIHYDYHIQALQLEYFQHKPNEYQKQLMKQICQSKYEQETSEQEYEFLKEQIAYYNLPSQSFESLTIPHHPFIDSIQNLTIREALMKQFKEVAIQSRIALFNIYLKSAEDQREEYQKKHEANRAPRKKCHGNRRDQRFRRKCRAEKMKPAKLKKLIKKRNHIYNKNKKPTTNIESTILNKKLLSSRQNYQQPIVTTNLSKRKRDISSQQLSPTIDLTRPKRTNSISIAQSSSKKMKNISEIMDNNSIINRNNNDTNKHINYRQPMYLTRSSSILYRILNKTLNYSLKKKDEKQFINVRLQLLDQQYCLEMDRQLWQSDLDIGLQQHLWPKIIKKQLNHCQFELTKQEQQFQTCSIKELSFEQMEQRLKELVDRERKYLSKRNNDKLIKFKDDISEKQRLTTISTTSHMNNQENEYINRLITIREKQGEI